MIQSKSIFQIIILLLAISLFTACEKDAELLELTTAEIADILEPALQKASGGLTEYVQTLIDNVEDLSTDAVCDSVYNRLINYNNPGTLVQADFESDWVFELACNNLNVPQSSLFDAIAVANYNTSRISAADNTSFSGNKGGLAPSTDVYNLNCNYVRIGTQELMGADPKSVNSSLVLDAANIEIEKPADIIQSGAGTFTLIGDIDGTNFSHAGDITFDGGGMATLTINGETFEVDLN